MSRLLILALALQLTACATIEQHPKTTAVVMGIVATSIAISVQHQNSGPIALLPPAALPCHPQPNGRCL